MRTAAFLAFFLSGASSLIFQSIWSRMLGRVFGASHIAISTTVTMFMAGLGLGAFIAGRYADRIKRPLIAYGIVEGLVGIWALLVPWLVDSEGWLAGVNAWLRNDVELWWARLLLRFLVVAPILLVPTTLMGSSLPLLSRHFVSRASDAGKVGAWVGALYSVNTFGAVAGVALGSFLLLPNLGVSTTNVVAASMNFALFALIFIFRRQLEGVAADAPQADEDKAAAKQAKETEKAERRAAKKARAEERARADAALPTAAEDAIAIPVTPFARKVAFFAFAASGLASLCYEVVWTRALAMTIGSSYQSFSLILMTFLIGIAGGSAVASGVIQGKRVLPTAAVASILLVLLANTTWAVGRDGDLLTWLILSGVFTAPIVVIWVAVASRRKTTGSTAVPVIPALLVLLSPACAALVNALSAGGRLAPIVAAVTITIAGFLALVIALRRYPVLQLATMALFIALAAFVNYAYQDEIPCAFASLVAGIDRLAEHVTLVRVFMWLTVALCLLPATIGMGAMFPLVLRVWTRGGSDVGRDVGNVYAGNTLGSILGAWLPGFVLMQTLGMEQTIIVGMFVYLGIALLLLVAAASEPKEPTDADAREANAKDDTKDEDAEQDATGANGDEEPSGPPTWYALTVYILAPLIPPMIVILALLGWRPPEFLSGLRWNQSQMTLGVFRVSLASDACSEAWGEPDLVYYHDGLSTTVSVERWGRHYAMKNNGKVDASNGDDMPTQIMVAAYPLLMHERGPRDLDVAVVGFGSGVSVGTAMKFPVRSVDVMELERAIPEASKFFEDVNGLDYVLPHFPYVEMDRLTIVNDDGRNYLASTSRQYDVIVSEPSNPWITGVSDLFTTDHWRITKKRLRPGGIYCQWVQLYELSPENIKTIYRTFASQFEHVVVFAAEDLSSDTVLLGSDSPLPLDLRRLREAYQIPGVAEELERAYVHSPYDVFSRLILGSKDEVLQFAQIEHRLRAGEWVAFPDSSNPPDRACPPESCRREPVVLNTDDNVHIEFAAPRDLIGYQRFEGYLANIYSPEWPYGRLSEHATGFSEGEDGARELAELALSLIAHGRKPEAAAFIARSQDAGTVRETRIAAEVITRLMTSENEPTVYLEEPTPGPQLAAREARTLAEGFARVREAVDQGAYAAALAAMEDIPSPLRLHSGPSLRLLHAYLLYKTAPTYQSRYREAIDLLEDLVRGDNEYVMRHPEIFYLLGRCHDAELHFDKGMRNMRLFVEARLLAEERAAQARDETEAEGDAPTTDDPAATDPPDGAHKATRDEP
ncbi:MAG: fused MFS/spermidine synthase [Myxococcales bacterium]|nr:fused MFS/spermidine synthase [Myxococcales bacterium]